MVLVFGFLPVSAYQTETIPDGGIQNDFVVSPGKIEVFIDAGNQKSVTLSVANRTGRDGRFILSTEDFTGSDDPNRAVVLQGELESSSSLKNFIYFPEEEFTLKHNERALIPITITVPGGTEAGGRFASVFVSFIPAYDESSGPNVSSEARVVARIGSLIFATVNGETFHDGRLLSFQTKNKKSLFGENKIPMQITFENNSTTHLNPYGLVTIRNVFGTKVGEVVIDPWFVLPDSVRLRDFVFSKENLFGMYSATLEMNRGYDDQIDESKINFFVLPIKETSALVLVLIALVVLVLVKNKKKNE